MLMNAIHKKSQEITCLECEDILQILNYATAY